MEMKRAGASVGGGCLLIMFHMNLIGRDGGHLRGMVVVQVDVEVDLQIFC